MPRIKIFIVSIICACLMTTFLFIAFQPVTITEIESLGRRTYIIPSSELPVTWEFYPQQGDMVHFQVSGNRSIHFYLFYSSEELRKFEDGEMCNFVQAWDLMQIDDRIEIYWSGKAWFVFVSENPATVSINLTLERQVTKLFYETWFSAHEEKPIGTEGERGLRNGLYLLCHPLDSGCPAVQFRKDRPLDYG